MRLAFALLAVALAGGVAAFKAYETHQRCLATIPPAAETSRYMSMRKVLASVLLALALAGVRGARFGL